MSSVLAFAATSSFQENFDTERKKNTFKSAQKAYFEKFSRYLWKDRFCEKICMSINRGYHFNLTTKTNWRHVLQISSK